MVSLLRRCTVCFAAFVVAGCPLDPGGADESSGSATESTTGTDTAPSSTMTATDSSMPTMTSPTAPATTVNPTGGETDTDTGSGMPTTIYEIQMGNVPEETTVTLTDVIVTSPLQTNDGGVLVQEADGGPYSGIYLFLFEDVVAGVSLSPGDVVTITGQYTEFFDFSQVTVFDANDIEVTGTTTVPEPELVNAADVAAGGGDAESYESVLVRVEGLTASDATNRFGDFHVDSDLVITNFFLWDIDEGLDVLPGTTFGFVQGPLLYNFEEFKVAPRSAADYDAMFVPCEDAATTATIYDVQQGMFAENDLVLVENVVVSSPVNFDGDTFWVQEPAGGAESGIAVFLSDPTGLAVTVGDQVSVCGAYAEFFDQSQIALSGVDDITDGGMGIVPVPEVLTAAEVGGGAMAESWEGVLVQVQGVTVTTEADMFGQWEVDSALLTDDVFFEMNDWPAPPIDTVYTSLTGVMTFSFDEYKLAPRDLADIVAE